MMDGEGAICTDGPASEGSSLLPLFFLRLLFFAPLPFSSSDTGFQPGTYLSSFFGGILRFRSEKIVGREVAAF